MTGDTQCFPFYIYDEDGTNRRENITDWALTQFRTHYGDESISKWDIFYYVYGILHHPGYREKFADNLKRELPRIPFAPEIAASALTPDPSPKRERGTRHRPHLSAGVSTGASQSAAISSSSMHSVSEQPAMSSEVT